MIKLLCRLCYTDLTSPIVGVTTPTLSMFQQGEIDAIKVIELLIMTFLNRPIQVSATPSMLVYHFRWSIILTFAGVSKPRAG